MRIELLAGTLPVTEGVAHLRNLISKLSARHVATDSEPGPHVHYKLGRYEEGVADCNRALALRPDHANTCNNRGLAAPDSATRKEHGPTFNAY
jgi:hypothetical protein